MTAEIRPVEDTKRATRRALLLNRLAYVALGFAFAQALTEIHTQSGVPVGVIVAVIVFLILRYASRRVLRNEIDRVRAEVQQLRR